MLVQEGVAIRHQKEAGAVRQGVCRKCLPVGELKRLYEDEGWSLKQLFAEYGTSAVTISKALKQAGVSVRGRGGTGLKGKMTLALPTDEIIRLYSVERKSKQDLAERFGCAPQTIGKVVEMAGGDVRGVAEAVALTYESKYVGIPVAEIVRLYSEEQWSIAALVREYDSTVKVVGNVLRRNRVEMRSSEESTRLVAVAYRMALPVEELIGEYESGTSLVALAQDYGCSPNTLKKLFADVGTPVRENGEAKRLRAAERRTCLPVGDIAHCYLEGQTLKALAADHNCCQETIKMVVVEQGIELRARGQLVRGSKHYGWRGGTSHEPYSEYFTEELREAVRERDGWRCRLCHVPECECLRKLGVHHVDYDKKNDAMGNLISLCLGCHARTNVQREYWEPYFRSLMEERYD